MIPKLYRAIALQTIAQNDKFADIYLRKDIDMERASVDAWLKWATYEVQYIMSEIYGADGVSNRTFSRTSSLEKALRAAIEKKVD
jgi:hypothetical protein